jgi:uncharacterized protein YjbI with pentapeptide repeats
MKKILFEPKFMFHADDYAAPVTYRIGEIESLDFLDINQDEAEAKMKTLLLSKINEEIAATVVINRVSMTNFYTITIDGDEIVGLDNANYILGDFREPIEGRAVEGRAIEGRVLLYLETFPADVDDEIRDSALDEYLPRYVVDFTDTDLSDVDFTETDYSGAIFYNANLTNANFTNAKLIKSNFTNANLTGAVFSDADMRKSVLTNATFNNLPFSLSFQRTNLRYATLDNVKFKKNNFTDADLRHATINNTTFTNCIVARMLVHGAIGQPIYINTTGNPNNDQEYVDETLNEDEEEDEGEEEEEIKDRLGLELIKLCYDGNYVDALDLIDITKVKYNMSLQDRDGNTALGYVIDGYDSSTSPEKEKLIELLIKDFSIKYPTDDECGICLNVLDGIRGPDDPPDADDDNDVITVCVNSHRFHRKCIIGVCDAGSVSCPICREKLIPSCDDEALDSKIKLPLPIPEEFTKFIPKKEGGRQIRKKPIKNKLVKTKTKSKKNKLVKTKTKSKTKSKKNKLVKTKTRKYTKP